MQSAQVNFETLPTSIRKDGGRLRANLRPPPPQSPFAPKITRLDSKAIVRTVKRFHRDEHLDANETAVFLRSLLYIMPQPYEYKYPAIRYADIFPVNYSVSSGAKSHAYHQYDELGNAQLMDSYADPAPQADRVGYEVIGGVWGIRSQYSYTIQDIRSQMLAGVPLDEMKAITARRMIERKCDTLAAVGDAAHNMTGIANDPNITAVTASTKAATGLKWGNVTGSTVTMVATPNEILNDCNTLLTGVSLTSKMTHTPDTLVFGTQNWSIINTLRLDSFNMLTVASYLLNSLPWLKAIEYWPQLDTAGASSKERILCLERARTNLEIVVPQEFEQFAPQWANLAATIQCHKRFAGVQMRFPKSISYMDGTV